MSELQPQSIRTLGIYGVIRNAEVDDKLIPDGAVTEVSNMNFDRKGVVQVRNGMTALGATISVGNSCLGMYNTQSQTMVAAFNTNVYYYTGASWQSTLTTVNASKTRFVDFAGRVIFINGTSDSMQAWVGSSGVAWESTGNPINPQQINNNSIKPKYIEVYKSRVYLAGDSGNPDRLYFSSVISTAGNITWAPTTDFVDINPSDGEHISALKRFSLELDVFKPNYIYRFRTSGTDPDPLIHVGTRSQESIIEGQKGLYFHHDTGFYQYAGGYPVNISRPISDFVNSIPYSSYANVAAWKDNDHIYWSVGDVTVNDPRGENTTWKNVVCRYTESSGVWTIYSLPSRVSVASDFNNSSTITRLVGLDNGLVATFDSGNTDIGEPIKYRVVTKWYEWEGPYTRKVLNMIVALCDKAQAVTLMYQTDGETTWHDLGQLRKYNTFFDNIAIRHYRIRFKLTGVSSIEPAIFLGLEIPLGINEGIIKS